MVSAVFEILCVYILGHRVCGEVEPMSIGSSYGKTGQHYLLFRLLVTAEFV